jgi:hypothetical protein
MAAVAVSPNIGPNTHLKILASSSPEHRRSAVLYAAAGDQRHGSRQAAEEGR